MVKGRTGRRREKERDSDRRKGAGVIGRPVVARAFVRRTRVVRVRWIQSSVNCLAARPAILSGLDYKVFHSELIAPRHLRWEEEVKRGRTGWKPCRQPLEGERAVVCPHCCPQQFSRISFLGRVSSSVLTTGCVSKRFGEGWKKRRARDARA